MEHSFSPRVTMYAGFSKVSGEISLREFFYQIGDLIYVNKVKKINQLIERGKLEEANNAKRQLPFFTITTNYHLKRLPESISAYNDLITIDIDNLSDEQVSSLRPLIEKDKATIGCFLTVKRHGFKIIAYLVNPHTQQWRETYLQAETITYDNLERYHNMIYEATRQHYEAELGVRVDVSGKDLSRGVFASYDSAVFFSDDRLKSVRQMNAQIILPTSGELLKRRGPKSAKSNILPITANELTEIDIVSKFEFNKCVALVQRKIMYDEGTHNPFLFALGNKCFRRGIPEEDTKRLAQYHFGENGKWDTDTPIENGYTYTSKTQNATKDKGNQVSAIEQVKNFLASHYRLRRNIILNRLEFMELPSDDAPPAAGETQIYQSLTAKDLNTMFLRISENGIKYALNNLKAIVDSDYAKPTDPFKQYFDELPAWDGITDYIGELAETVTTTDQAYWHMVFRRWITGMVACAIDSRAVNQQVLLLYGKQGKGKSTWIQKLLPPELQEYYSNGMIDTTKKDHMLLLSTRMLINMEEFEGVKFADIPNLKRIISQEKIILRQHYEIQTLVYTRRASFIGSTNSTRFLSDMSGSRRFLVVETLGIDYRKPVNYSGLYSQALSLFRNGFQYWFEADEIDKINDVNEYYRMKDPLEENLYVYFQPANSKDLNMKWKPAATILSYLSGVGRTQANALTQQLLIQILERDQFKKRTNQFGITEYAVLPLTMEEIEQKAKQEYYKIENGQ